MGRSVKAIGIIALIISSIPTAIVLFLSFSGDASLKFPPSSFSLEPYAEVLGPGVYRDALMRSLQVSLIATAIAIAVGIPATLALYKHRIRFRSLITGYLTLGFATPLVVSGFGFLLLVYRIGQFGEIWPTAVALAVVNFPFLLFTLSSAVMSVDKSYEEAAATLGADRTQTFLFVTFPLIIAGVVAGGLLVFVLSLTEFIVSLILATTENATLPVVIFGGLRGSLSPHLAAAAGIYVVIALIVVFAISRIRSLERFLFPG